ncbi:MAG: hypothetical protein P0S95_04010 [Rhabdochlamydiaceae bacterium]|nr:hypothetical protein [Candidatus Amphrikana amoebophyrae]
MSYIVDKSIQAIKLCQSTYDNISKEVSEEIYVCYKILAELGRVLARDSVGIVFKGITLSRQLCKISSIYISAVWYGCSVEDVETFNTNRIDLEAVKSPLSNKIVIALLDTLKLDVYDKIKIVELKFGSQGTINFNITEGEDIREKLRSAVSTIQSFEQSSVEVDIIAYKCIVSGLVLDLGSQIIKTRVKIELKKSGWLSSRVNKKVVSSQNIVDELVLAIVHEAQRLRSFSPPIIQDYIVDNLREDPAIPVQRVASVAEILINSLPRAAAAA